jgi:hypothetical protein
MHSEHGHTEGRANAIQYRLGQIVEAITSEPVSGQRENARLQRISLGIRVEKYELLGGECSQYMQTGTRHEAQLTRDSLHAERRIAFSKQAQNGCGTRDRGRFAGAQSALQMTVRGCGTLLLSGHFGSPSKGAVLYIESYSIFATTILLWHLVSAMAKLTEYTAYADAQQFGNSKALWSLFDGDS